MANHTKTVTLTDLQQKILSNDLYNDTDNAGLDAWIQAAVDGKINNAWKRFQTAANKTSSGVTIDIFIDNEDGSNDVYIVKGASIPAGASLEVMSGNKLVLMNDGTNGDNLEALASAGSAVDVTVSVLEDV